jgi:hypothetical protein
MYLLRAFRPADWAALRAMHDGSFEIPQRMEETIVVADEETDEAVLIMGNRVTRESYVWLRHDWKTPQLRWRVFKEAHEEMTRELARKGVDEIFIWVAPTKSGRLNGFAKRLMKRFGWVPAPWKCLSLKIRE